MNAPLDREALRAALEASTDELLDLSVELLNADGGRVYMPDFFVIGAAQRALSPSTAIFKLLDEEHAIAAATLGRPHLDTLLRLHSLWLVPDVSEHVAAVMRGERLDRRKDRAGRRLTDRLLMASLAAQPGMAWVASVYERTSGFVHLSEAALLHPLSGFDGESRQGSVLIQATYKASLADELEMKSFAVRVNHEVASRVSLCIQTKSER